MLKRVHASMAARLPQIAMTFNVGLFCAVIVGYMLGAYIFASVPDNFLAYLQVDVQLCVCGMCVHTCPLADTLHLRRRRGLQGRCSYLHRGPSSVG